MPYVPPYNSQDFASPFDGFELPGTFLRQAVITSVHPDKGTVNIEWLDHPSMRQEILLPMSGQGIYELPTIGSTVLVGFGKGYSAYILRYLPVGYRDLVGTPRIDAEGKSVQIVPTIRKIYPGEKMLVSYLKDPGGEKTSQFITPAPTGTYFYMSNVGDIYMETAEGDSWKLDRLNNIIEQNSMNFRAVTEAGVLDFGLVKREFTEGKSIISVAGNPLGSSGQSTEEALTEFRLRILETADANSLTEPEVDNPFIELTLGTKIKKVSDEVFELDKTDSSHAQTSDGNSKEIMIQLKTKADQGFEFTIDKEGNLTIKVKGNVRMDVVGNSDINVNGNATVNIDKDASIRADNMVFTANSIRIAGNDKEQPVVLEEFLKAYYNRHKHWGNMGAPTSPPIKPAPRVPGKDISNITQAG